MFTGTPHDYVYSENGYTRDSENGSTGYSENSNTNYLTLKCVHCGNSNQK